MDAQNQKKGVYINYDGGGDLSFQRKETKTNLLAIYSISVLSKLWFTQNIRFSLKNATKSICGSFPLKPLKCGEWFHVKADSSGTSHQKLSVTRRNKAHVVSKKKLTLFPKGFALIFLLCKGKRNPFNFADHLQLWMQPDTAVIRKLKEEGTESKNCSLGARK